MRLASTGEPGRVDLSMPPHSILLSDQRASKLTTPAVIGMDRNSKIYLAGHRGLVGSAILRKLSAESYTNVIMRTHEDLDLTSQAAVTRYFHEHRPEHVLLAAARVGGIEANRTYPASLIRDNLLIQTNVIDASYTYGVRKLLFLASSAVYPRAAAQPLKEEYLLTGPLDWATEPYAIAKIAGIKQIQAYRRQYGFHGITVIPPNVYGVGDHFDLETSHVLPALIRKFHDAKVNEADRVIVWGNGTATREFLHADDLADACLFLMQEYDDAEIVNVGTGEEIQISDLAELVSKIVGYEGTIDYDSSRPAGVPRRRQDISRILDMGWRPKISLENGIREVYRWHLEQVTRVAG